METRYQTRSRHKTLALIKRCINNDAAAWESLVSTFQPIIRSLAGRALRIHGLSAPPDEVDDLTSAVYLALLENRQKSLRSYHSRFAFSTWLGVLMKTALNRKLRKRAPVPIACVEQAECRREHANPADALIRKETFRRVRHALSALFPRDRLLLRLYYQDGASYREIAEILDIETNSVGPALHRARLKMRGKLSRVGISAC